ncbi:hypothetical protein [Faecalicatena contorta]|uniref:hypothetical protein n=1 Tax=Faecalicatena contorta TaxID=39482 RepID=UPI00129D34EC|nr:hypothetical protein [Faecalicatena contorta]
MTRRFRGLAGQCLLVKCSDISPADIAQPGPGIALSFVGCIQSAGMKELPGGMTDKIAI